MSEKNQMEIHHVLLENRHLGERSGRHTHIQKCSIAENKQVNGLLKSLCVEDILRNQIQLRKINWQRPQEGTTSPIPSTLWLSCPIGPCVLFTLIEKLKGREESRPGQKKLALGLRNKQNEVFNQLYLELGGLDWEKHVHLWNTPQSDSQMRWHCSQHSTISLWGMSLNSFLPIYILEAFGEIRAVPA